MDDLAAPQAVDSDEAARGEDEIHYISLKDGDTFLVSDTWGDLRGAADGLFSNDTRILSRFRLLIGGKRPSRLSFSLSDDNATFTVNGANRALPPVGGPATPRGVIHMERKRCLHGGRLFERLRLANFGLDEVMAPIVFEFDADFRDVFEVRGLVRGARGATAPPKLTGRGVAMSYDGLDGVRRTAVVAFSEPPWRLAANRAEFMLPVIPGRRVDLFIEVGPRNEHPPDEPRFERALTAARAGVRAVKTRGARLTASDGAFDAWLQQSRTDVAILTTELATGAYPYAGIPWFSTPFGRDGIFCAWQLLWLDPSLAKGVLSYLAARQACDVSSFEDATPGKIMHETRSGEMAALREVPFGLYYGGVDTTPLFVALAGAYFERTGDTDFISALWPNLRAATLWMETFGDSNGDGLIDYARAEQTGLANQGWKDSLDSIFHDDGRLAPGPVALVEVQGYACAAWRAMAAMGVRMGDEEAPRCRASAVHRCAEHGPGETGDPSPAFGGVRQRLGPAHTRRRRRALQPDVLPQRLGVAPRYGHCPGWHGQIWRAHRRHQSHDRSVRGVQDVREPHARTAVRLRTREGRAADRLPRRLHATGVVGGFDVHDDLRLPWPQNRRPSSRDQTHPPPASFGRRPPSCRAA